MSIWLNITGRSDDVPSRIVARRKRWGRLANESGHKTYLERLGKLFAGDKRVHSGLLWRPPLDRVQVEQTLAEIDKRRAVVELYRKSQINNYAIMEVPAVTSRTFFHLMALPSRRLERRHGRSVDDLRERRRLKVLFPGLFVRVVFARILLQCLEPVLFVTEHVHIGIKELFGLLPHVQHVRGRHPAFKMTLTDEPAGNGCK